MLPHEPIVFVVSSVFSLVRAGRLARSMEGQSPIRFCLYAATATALPLDLRVFDFSRRLGQFLFRNSYLRLDRVANGFVCCNEVRNPRLERPDDSGAPGGCSERGFYRG